jgi:hypothetical protein
MVSSPTAVKIQPMMLPGRRATSRQPTTKKAIYDKVDKDSPGFRRKLPLAIDRRTPAA